MALQPVTYIRCICVSTPHKLILRLPHQFGGGSQLGEIDTGGELVVRDTLGMQFTLCTVSEQDVLRQVTALRKGSAPGLDGSKDPKLSFAQTADQPDLDPSPSFGARHITGSVPVSICEEYILELISGTSPWKNSRPDLSQVLLSTQAVLARPYV
ncbi:hypothetical protein J6590_091838 [Homalodisca vitripennis]|nr:hypothetical protein J6590_091838 [Homalodisca vitripennis]